MFAAVVLSVEPTDAGSDTPFEDADAGVYQVASATRFDGGTLPPGWYLTGGRMQKLGDNLVDLQNRVAKDEAPVASDNNLAAYWAGVGSGAATVITIFSGAYLLFKK